MFYNLRWSISIHSKKAFRAQQKLMFMYNYLSLGVDAQVTLNFHLTRQSRFYIFSHRIFNKVNALEIITSVIDKFIPILKS